MAKVVKRMLKDTAQKRNEQWLKSAKPVSIKIGDWILLRDKKIKLRKLVQATTTHTGVPVTESAKFQSEWLGPYKVIKVLTNAVTIDDTDRNEQRSVSLANIKFFHTKSVEKDESLTSSSLEKQVDDPNSIKEVDSQQEIPTDENHDPLKWYIIEKILDFRRSKQGYEYLIKWENYDDTHNSWTKSSNIQGEEALQEFWSQNASNYSLNLIPVKYREYFKNEEGVRGGKKRSKTRVNVNFKRRRHLKE
jgi:hypothetical protein